MDGIIGAWGKILIGRSPALSIEVTRECPLRCPGCYAYGDEHLGGDVTLRELSDYRGDELIDRVMRLVWEHRPLHVSIVGGEPLVRYRELDVLLPRIAALGIYTQLVTSAVRPIPLAWRDIPRLQIVVSIDGLQPEHDARRSPATYERILQHIPGHRLTIHCTVTRQQVQRADYLAEFVRFWSGQPATQRIWFSLYTPQVGEQSDEQLTPDDRRRVVEMLAKLREEFPKLEAPEPILEGYLAPPASPYDCIFARTTTCYSADLRRQITPCQFGGEPDCASCGCMASAGLAAIGRHRLPGGVRVGTLFQASARVGTWVGRVRQAAAALAPPSKNGSRHHAGEGAAASRAPKPARESA